MVAVPATPPVTTPVELTLAMDVLLLLHTPPDVVSDNVKVLPIQTLLLPIIGPIANNGNEKSEESRMSSIFFIRVGFV